MALKYAESLKTSTPPDELEEGADDNELFWVILGTEEYANADHWRWRPSATLSSPRIWKIEVRSSGTVGIRFHAAMQELTICYTGYSYRLLRG
jgi:hypothetical protein